MIALDKMNDIIEKLDKTSDGFSNFACVSEDIQTTKTEIEEAKNKIISVVEEIKKSNKELTDNIDNRFTMCNTKIDNKSNEISSQLNNLLQQYNNLNDRYLKIHKLNIFLIALLILSTIIIITLLI